MKISVTEKAAIFDMLCGTKHVFFVVDSPSGKMSVMFKANYVEQPGHGNFFFSARSLFASACPFRHQFGADMYRARDLSNADEVKAYCLDMWMKFTKNRNPIMHNGRVLLPAYATYEEVRIKLDLQGSTS